MCSLFVLIKKLPTTNDFPNNTHQFFFMIIIIFLVILLFIVFQAHNN